MNTSSIRAGSTPERCSAALMLVAPSVGALKLDKAPKYAPMGVRAAETM
jgi:hypothetical protein